MKFVHDLMIFAFDNLYKRHKAIAKWENSDLIAMRDKLKLELGER